MLSFRVDNSFQKYKKKVNSINTSRSNGDKVPAIFSTSILTQVTSHIKNCSYSSAGIIFAGSSHGNFTSIC